MSRGRLKENDTLLDKWVLTSYETPTKPELGDKSVWNFDRSKNVKGCWKVDHTPAKGEKHPNVKVNKQQSYGTGPVVMVFKTSNRSNAKTKIKVWNSMNIDYFDFNKFTRPKDKKLWYAMMGYWQSEKYFKENEEIIRKELDASDEIKYNIEKRYNWLGSEDTVSIHIRRTDYLTSKGYHPVQPISYYEQALNLIDHEKILVFSK